MTSMSRNRVSARILWHVWRHENKHKKNVNLAEATATDAVALLRELR